MADALAIVTAASQNHAAPLHNLLFSLDCYEPRTPVIVYDLGLEAEALDVLRRQRRTVLPFPYEDYPSHIRFETILNCAWKPPLMRDAMQRAGLPLLWLDAGNLAHAPLAKIRSELATTGFYSPVSAGRVREWTHPGTLAALRVEPDLLELRNRNGAVIGLGTGEMPRRLLEDWSLAALQPEIIVPPGASKTNHRFDQSVLTILAIRASRRHGLALADDLFDVSVHNDYRDFTNANLYMRGPAPLRQRKPWRPPVPAEPPPPQSRLHAFWSKARNLLARTS